MACVDSAISSSKEATLELDLRQVFADSRVREKLRVSLANVGLFTVDILASVSSTEEGFQGDSGSRYGKVRQPQLPDHGMEEGSGPTDPSPRTSPARTDQDSRDVGSGIQRTLVRLRFLRIPTWPQPHIVNPTHDAWNASPGSSSSKTGDPGL